MGGTSQDGEKPIIYHDILTFSNFITWLGMTIYVNKPEAPDNMQLIEYSQQWERLFPNLRPNCLPGSWRTGVLWWAKVTATYSTFHKKIVLLYLPDSPLAICFWMIFELTVCDGTSSSGGSESIASSASRDIIDISVSSDSRDNNVSRGSSDISIFCDIIASSSIKHRRDSSDNSDSFDRCKSR